MLCESSCTFYPNKIMLHLVHQQLDCSMTQCAKDQSYVQWSFEIGKSQCSCISSHHTNTCYASQIDISHNLQSCKWRSFRFQHTCSNLAPFLTFKNHKNKPHDGFNVTHQFIIHSYRFISNKILCHFDQKSLKLFKDHITWSNHANACVLIFYKIWNPLFP